jgi:hypothetical protein
VLLSLNSAQIAAGQGVTASTLSTLTESMTYNVPASGNTFTKVTTGVASNGNTLSESGSVTISYQDSASNDSFGTFSDTYTSGPQSGSIFQTGTFTSSGLDVTPLTPAMLAGKTLTLANQCSGTGSLQLAFSSDGTSAAETCGTGSGTVTIASSPIPGILLITSSSGLIIYAGLVGSSLAPGASLAFIQEDAGHGGWGTHQILTVQ